MQNDEGDGRGMRAGDANRRRSDRCVRTTPIWSGKFLTIRDRNYTVDSDPETGEDIARARLWVRVGPDGTQNFAKARSLVGPADALLKALRLMLAHEGGLDAPDVQIVGTPDEGLVRPELGTRSHAFVHARFMADGGEEFDVRTTYTDQVTALFLAYGKAYDRALYLRWEALLRRAHMTPLDVMALRAPPGSEGEYAREETS